MKTFRSIRTKLLTVVLLTTSSALLVAGGAILVYDINSYRTTTLNDMNSQIELLAYSSAPALQFFDESVANENLNLLRIRPTIKSAAIYNSRGNLFASYVRQGEILDFPVLPGEEGVTIDGSGLSIFKRIIENDEILGSAYIQADYLLGERVLNFVGILSIVAIGSMLVAVFVSLWLQSVITRPIQSIVGIAGGVIKNKNYSRRAEKLSEDEVGVLVDAVNDMLDEIESRTAALEASNLELEQEVSERKRAREEILRLNEELEKKVLDRTRQLEATNKELESFCYSVSHDLRGPLRSISGFSQALIEELPKELPGESKRFFDKITTATTRMGQLIDDLLNLSRVSRGDLLRQNVDLSTMASEITQGLRSSDPDYKIDISIWDGIEINCDPKLLRIVLENLISNAWKFTSKKDHPRLEVGSMRDEGREIIFVRDNGAGFDMKYADKLCGAFQRLHAMDEFPGTGIGLATVQRIINRHGGRMWFDSSPGNGAVFYFTLSAHRKAENKNVSKDAELNDRKGMSKLRSV